MRNDWRYPKGMFVPPESDLASAVHLSDHIKVIKIQILLDPLFQCLGLAISAIRERSFCMSTPITL